MDSDNGVPLSTKVVELLAEEEGVPPSNLDFSLYEKIDPEILDQLDSETRADWELVFEVRNYLVQVTSEGTVTVDASQDESEPSLR